MVLTAIVAIIRVTKKNRACEEISDRINATVLVLFSQASPKKDEECILENVVKTLNEYSIGTVFFDRPQVKAPVPDWVAAQVKSSNKVLLVCNKQFAAEWNKATEDNVMTSSVVYVLRQVINGYVNHDRGMLEKFAVLYLRKKDANLIDSPFLKNMAHFFVDPHNEKQMEQIVRFIDNKSTYSFV